MDESIKHECVNCNIGNVWTLVNMDYDFYCLSCGHKWKKKEGKIGGNMEKEYWVCIIEPRSMEQFNEISEKSSGLDCPPRRGAIENLENAGVDVSNCSSGWGCNEILYKNLMKVWNEEKYKNELID